MTDRNIKHEEHTVHNLYTAICASPNAYLWTTKWVQMASELGVPQTKIDLLGRNMLDQNSTLNMLHVFDTIIGDWCSRSNDNDTSLTVFLDVLKNCDLNDAADTIRNKLCFNYDMPPKFICVPIGFDQFTLLESQHTLVICTLDCSITFQKILRHSKSRIDVITEMDLDTTDELPLNNTMKVLVCKFDVYNLLQRRSMSGNMSSKLIIITMDSEENVRNINDGSIVTITDSLHWSDLSESFQTTIKAEKSVKFQNVLVKFEMFLEGCGDWGNTILTHFQGQTLIDLINGINPTVFKQPSLPSIEGYIPRKLISRMKLSSDIFKIEATGIFLFTGIERHQLCRLVWRGITSTSSAQIESGTISVKYVALQATSHFEAICTLTSDPVHWLHHEHGNFYWVKSRGDMTIIQKLSKESPYQDIYSEDQLQILTSTESAVCISDMPGEGKSFLLASIGHYLVHERKSLVIFVTLKDFISLIKINNIGLDYISEATVINSLAPYICTSEKISTLAFQIGLQNGSLKVDLLCDGYDEIDCTDLNLTNKCFRLILQVFRSVRLWVTTRPHLLLQLENALEVLGYNLVPFSAEELEQLLPSFWLTKNANDTNTDASTVNWGEVRKQWKHVLASGQCVFQGAPTKTVNKIAALYEKIVDNKCHTSDSNNNQATVHNALVYYAFQTFPEWSKSKVTPNITDSIGKCEVTFCPRFVHSSLADYVIARFIYNKLSTDWDDDHADFLLRQVLSTFPETVQVSKISKSRQCAIPSFKFKYNGIVTFLDAFLEQSVPSVLIGSDCFQSIAKSLAFACIHDNRVNIFNYLVKSQLFEKVTRQVFISHLLFLSSNRCSIPVLDTIATKFEAWSGRTLPQIEIQECSILQVVVERGDHSLFEYLLHDKIFDGEILKNPEVFSPVLYHLLTESRQCDETVLQEKIEILKIVLKTGDHSKIFGTTDGSPLYCDGIHIELLLELVRQVEDAVLLMCHPCGKTFIHFAARYLSNYYFHQLISTLPLPVLEQVVILGKDSILHEALVKFDPDPDTLQTLLTAGADFNAVDSQGHSILYTAIEHHRSNLCLEQLVKFGADHTKLDTFGGTYLHVASAYGNLSAVNLFTGPTLGINPNQTENKKCSPLHYAVSASPPNVMQIVESLVEAGGCIYTQTDGKTLLHHAVIKDCLDVIQYLISQGLDINCKDSKGSTPIQLLLDSRSKIKLEVVHLFLQNLVDLRITTRSRHENLLHIAAKHDELEILRLLLKWRVDVNSKDVNKNTPLHIALHHLHQDNAQVLMECGADVFAVNSKGQTMLHLAAAGAKQFEIVQVLTSQGLDVNAPDKNGNTPLHYAVRKRSSLEIVKFLLQHGACANKINKDNLTPIQNALADKPDVNMKTLNFILSCRNISCQDIATPSLLQVLAGITSGEKDYCCQVAHKCVALGANLNCRDAKNRSLLHYVIEEGWLSLVKLIIDSKTVDVNIQTVVFKQTPLHYAMLQTSNQCDLVKMLVLHGADVNIVDYYNRTPLEFALRENPCPLQLDTLHWCLSQREVIFTPELAELALITVIQTRTYPQGMNQQGYTQLLQNCVDKGASLLYKDKRGNSLLHLATRAGSAWAVKYLLDSGVNVNYLNKAARSVVDVMNCKLIGVVANNFEVEHKEKCVNESVCRSIFEYLIMHEINY